MRRRLCNAVLTEQTHWIWRRGRGQKLEMSLCTVEMASRVLLGKTLKLDRELSEVYKFLPSITAKCTWMHISRPVACSEATTVLKRAIAKWYPTLKYMTLLAGSGFNG